MGLVSDLLILFPASWGAHTLSRVLLTYGRISSVQLSFSVMSNSLRPYELQHARVRNLKCFRIFLLMLDHVRVTEL